METKIRLITGTAAHMAGIETRSVDLIVTSPPYPMIEMWDAVFAEQDERIRECLEAGRAHEAFGLMHSVLDAVWAECDRVLKPGGLVCINIGDATRTIGGGFELYCNHSRILQALLNLGYAALPDILWRKPTNAPNKFLGSGMLPGGAYVKYEHEYILVFRKGPRRQFLNAREKRLRRESAFFWEERNVWFSDVWQDIKGTGQGLPDAGARERSAAFPFEIPHRLICMFSVKEDLVLDPFFGTGTTLVAAMAAGRNAVGIEIDPSLVRVARGSLLGARDFVYAYSRERLSRHSEFVATRSAEERPMKYTSLHYGFPVMTSQETHILIDHVTEVTQEGEDIIAAYSSDYPLDAGLK
jgi:DNA modification methylase